MLRIIVRTSLDPLSKVAALNESTNLVIGSLVKTLDIKLL